MYDATIPLDAFSDVLAASNNMSKFLKVYAYLPSYDERFMMPFIPTITNKDSETIIENSKDDIPAKDYAKAKSLCKGENKDNGKS